MVLQVTIPAAGTLQFIALVSSESGDKAYFSIGPKVGTAYRDGLALK